MTAREYWEQLPLSVRAYYFNRLDLAMNFITVTTGGKVVEPDDELPIDFFYTLEEQERRKNGEKT